MSQTDFYRFSNNRRNLMHEKNQPNPLKPGAAAMTTYTHSFNRTTSEKDFLKNNKSSIYQDSWLEKISENSLYSAHQFYEEKVPYNRYLRQLRNESTDLVKQQQKKKIVFKPKKKTNLDDNGDLLNSLRDRNTEKSEYQTHFKKKSLPLLSVIRPKTQQYYSQSVMNDDRIQEQFEGLECDEDPIEVATNPDEDNNFGTDEQQEQRTNEEGSENIEDIEDAEQYNNQFQNFKTAESENKFFDYNRSNSDDIMMNSGQSVAQSYVESFLDQNPDYMKHLKGDCTCVQDKCGLCKCKFKNVSLKPDLQFSNQSLYNKDFSYKNRKRIPQTSLGGVDTIKRLNSNGDWKPDHIKMQSISQRDYKKNPIQKTEMCRPEDQKYSDAPVPRSQYQAQYFDYGKTPFCLVKRGKDRTTHDMLPFYSSTTYGECFTPQNNKDPAIPTLNNWKTSLVKSPVPFLSITTSQNFYKPFKHKDRIEKHTVKGNLDIGRQGNYKGQFLSRYTKDYKKQLDKSCQIKVDNPRNVIFDGSQYVVVKSSPYSTLSKTRNSSRGNIFQKVQ